MSSKIYDRHLNAIGEADSDKAMDLALRIARMTEQEVHLEDGDEKITIYPDGSTVDGWVGWSEPRERGNCYGPQRIDGYEGLKNNWRTNRYMDQFRK
jgi:hypothetical protein